MAEFEYSKEHNINTPTSENVAERMLADTFNSAINWVHENQAEAFSIGAILGSTALGLAALATEGKAVVVTEFLDRSGSILTPLDLNLDAKVVERELERPRRIHETAFVHPLAQLGEDVEIGPGAFIGPNVIVKNGAKIKADAIILNATIGEVAIIRRCAKIGAMPGIDLSEPTDLERLKELDVRLRDISDWTHIGKGVTIGKLTTIGPRVVVGDGSKVGNYVLLAHGGEFGSQVHIHDYVETEPRVKVADKALLEAHVKLGEGSVVGSVIVGEEAKVAAGAQINGNLGKKAIVQTGAIVHHDTFVGSGLTVVGIS